jgi:parallel beta-helix repeat protein
MTRSAVPFSIALILGAAILVPEVDAQAAPIPIKECQTISQPGSYVLERNLSGLSTIGGDCLVITADFVTIDLAGFTITGGGRAGIAAPQGGIGIAVRNGSINHFAMGVDLSSAGGSIVEGLRVFGGISTPGFGITANGIVKGNSVLSFFGDGISATGTVTDNYAAGNRDTGIIATGTVRGNVATDNSEGIHAGVGSTVIGNTATNNRTQGAVGFLADCPSNLTDNTAVNNGRNLVLNGDGCHDEDNVAP